MILLDGDILLKIVLTASQGVVCPRLGCGVPQFSQKQEPQCFRIVGNEKAGRVEGMRKQGE